MKKLLLIVTLALTGCATQPTDPSNPPSAQDPTWLQFVEPSSNLVCSAVLLLAVSDADRQEKADMIDGVAAAVRSLMTGQIPDPQKLQDTIALWAPDKAHWADLATSLKSVYAGVFASVKGNPKLAMQVLEKIAEGCDDAAVLYDSKKTN